MKIEVAIPCYNEKLTIEKVIRDFQTVIPSAEIVVYDNNSIDRSARLAKNADARVVKVIWQGKGHVLQHIFETSKADIIVIVDGDDTYEARDVNLLIAPIKEEMADMTIGTRLHVGKSEFRGIHHFGNRVATSMLNGMFGVSFGDILSGYRAFSRRFIEHVPVISTGFEIETELMIQGLEHGMVIIEMPIRYKNRPDGSESKLNTFKDGYRILGMMTSMLRDHRPLLTFSIAAAFAAFSGLILWVIGFIWGSKHAVFEVFRSAGALLSLVTIGLLLVGLILNTVNTRMKELLSLVRRSRQ
jgi:glycosyltransferase involved in cell wall biosynthesis